MSQVAVHGRENCFGRARLREFQDRRIRLQSLDVRRPAPFVLAGADRKLGRSLTQSRKARLWIGQHTHQPGLEWQRPELFPIGACSAYNLLEIRLTEAEIVGILIAR